MESSTERRLRMRRIHDDKMIEVNKSMQRMTGTMVGTGVGMGAGLLYAHLTGGEARKKRESIKRKFNATLSPAQKVILNRISELEAKIESIERTSNKISSTSANLAGLGGLSANGQMAIRGSGDLAGQLLSREDLINKDVLIRRYTNTLTREQIRMSEEIESLNSKAGLRALGSTIVGAALGGGLAYLSIRAYQN